MADSMEVEAVGAFAKLMSGDNPLVALLSTIVVTLSGIIVYQWRYTMNSTVPKWIWDSLMGKVEQILETQRTISTIMDERIKK